MSEREQMEFDVVIVGAGPAGLPAAIRLKQLAPETTVCMVEKGAEVGAHILSGAFIEPRALDELLPNWRQLGAPLHTQAREDRFLFLTERRAFRLPTPLRMHNEGNYIASLGDVTRWLGQQAEALDVEVYSGFAVATFLEEDGRVVGIGTGDMGITKEGSPGANHTPGVDLRATYTLLAEGCRGSLSKQVMTRFDLRQGRDPQTYAIGIKELWEIPAGHHKPDLVEHTTGWPLDRETYGGSWLYHCGNNLVSYGFVVGLDYRNPWLSPFDEMQRFKTHPKVRHHFEGGRRVSYGARALSEGGFQSIPKLTFPGGALIGDAAGFLNGPKIKGTHAAMKPGILAAEAVADALANGSPAEPATYEVRFRSSWLHSELRGARNVRPAFARFGLFGGIAYSAMNTVLLHGKAPWTLHHKHHDNETLAIAASVPKINYPKPDGKLTFDRLSSVFISNTNHDEDQPVHLRLKDPGRWTGINWEQFASPESRYCPAAVYEAINLDKSEPRLQINAQNCIHCKTCDIKDPSQNIDWQVPEGAGGPNYPGGM